MVTKTSTQCTALFRATPQAGAYPHPRQPSRPSFLGKAGGRTSGMSDSACEAGGMEVAPFMETKTSTATPSAKQAAWK
jgi:hypothetical protein